VRASNHARAFQEVHTQPDMGEIQIDELGCRCAEDARLAWAYSAMEVFTRVWLGVQVSRRTEQHACLHARGRDHDGAERGLGPYHQRHIHRQLRMPRASDSKNSTARGTRVSARAPTGRCARLAEARGLRAASVNNSLESDLNGVGEVRGRLTGNGVTVPGLKVPGLSGQNADDVDGCRSPHQV